MQETSLRTPRRAPNRNTTVSQVLPRAPKSRVDDRIKKRMSMRYADIAPGNDAVPPLPGFPPIVLDGEGVVNLDRSFATMGDDDVRDRRNSLTTQDDKTMLDDERFDPDNFLKVKLANSTEAQLKSLQSSLHDAKEDTNAELQRSVFKNYAEFVFISKEITSLESEMLELKDLLSEYKYMPFLLHVPDPTIQSSNPHLISAYKRSSVADLRVLYHNQMQELHATIEGSAKFAPTMPGRHIVSEIEGIVSLNAATYKAIGRVQFVIMDDLVLVARRRRRKAANVEGSGGGSRGAVNEGKLVAEICWPLNEMLVLDTKDSPRMTNVFKIRHGKETYVYRTEQSQDKKSLLQQLRQVAEELASKKRKEREGEHERRKSLWQAGSTGGDRSSVPPMPEWMADLASKGGEIPGFDEDGGAKQKAEQDSLWAAQWADDLTVAIALREWEKAVTLVETGKARLSVTPPLAQKLPPLNAQLISSLLETLSVPSIRKSAVVSTISYLCRLKAGHAARDTFLQMRTAVLKVHVRKIKFDGNIALYIGELAVVYFTGIKHTADWFLASFKENEVASAFIDWAKNQIEDFAEIFRKQVFTADVDPKLVQNALNITYTQSRKLLQEYGLDFRFLFDGLLTQKPTTPTQFIPQLTIQDSPSIPAIEPVPSRRRKAPGPPSQSSSSSVEHNLPALQVDTLAPLASAAPIRSSPRTRNSPLPSATGSSYSVASNYSNMSPVTQEGATPNLAIPNRENTRILFSPDTGSIDLPRTPQSGFAQLRSRTPASAAPSRVRTPVSTAPPSRPRTPVSSATHQPAAPSRARTPAATHASPSAFQSSVSEWDRGKDGKQSLVAQTPGRTRSPTGDIVSSRPETRDTDQGQDRERGKERDEERDRETPLRPFKSPIPPPRSVRRPGSTEVSVRQLREGMF